MGTWGSGNFESDCSLEIRLNPPIAPRPDLAQKAIAALEKVAAPNSELAVLWAESGRQEEWATALRDLRNRLNESMRQTD
jgi:hypothetical protein